MTLVLLLAAAAVLLSLAGAWLSTRALREAVAERQALRQGLRELGDRIAGIERTAGQASTQAEVTSHLLLEKGIADEEDLEAVRQLVLEPEADPDGGQTLH